MNARVLLVAACGITLAGCADLDLNTAAVGDPPPAASCSATVGAALEGVAQPRRRPGGERPHGQRRRGADRALDRARRRGRPRRPRRRHGGAAPAAAQPDPAHRAHARRPRARLARSRGRARAGDGADPDRAGTAVGRFVLSTSTDAHVASQVHGLTGAQVEMVAGHTRVASTPSPLPSGARVAATASPAPAAAATAQRRLPRRVAGGHRVPRAPVADHAAQPGLRRGVVRADHRRDDRQRARRGR